ncbi:unnamed protein product [Cyclocybe aegerita]|uniref:Flavin-binding monooxygenase n=1 Tax=Cyclocybe aegerita TaxID=1973307 RepID=A0A8S0XXV8_CYCAE|nr:unnamed protein product [Cyclocybe aegerita]
MSTLSQDGPYRMGDFAIDDPRPMRVVVIGAGYAGIVAGIRFLQRVPNLELTIYDANAGIGGTWYSNRYPGLSCDIPSHGYQLTFDNYTGWSAFYATGQEIQKNMETIVDKYELRPYIKLSHRLTCARYAEDTGKWHLTIKKPRSKEDIYPKNTTGKIGKPDYDTWYELQDTCDLLFLGVGGLSRWVWPDIAGLDSFNGKVIHSANWYTGTDPEKGWEESIKNWGDKTIGVIGVGSSAIQIVAALQPKVKRIMNYVRGKTWISSTFVRERLMKLSGGEVVENYHFTEKDREAFKDPDYYREFRRELEREMNGSYGATLLSNPLVETARIDFRQSMLKKLEKKPWIADHLIPSFPVACRRLTPGPGFLEALCEDNVDFIPTLIKCVTPTGIETVDGSSQELDVVICATGFDTSYQLDFDVIGRGGMTMKQHQTPHPKAYLSIAVNGFPNLFYGFGPNSGVGSGNLLLIIERQVDYAVAATLKLQRERLKSIEVKPEAVEAFEEYIDAYFPTTVFGTKCKSWYKQGREEGRVVGLWPGSSMHAQRVLTHPRWEDYNYELLDNVTNPLYWIGNGDTVAGLDPTRFDSSWYLKPDHIDYPPVPLQPRAI